MSPEKRKSITKWHRDQEREEREKFRQQRPEVGRRIVSVQRTSGPNRYLEKPCYLVGLYLSARVFVAGEERVERLSQISKAEKPGMPEVRRISEHLGLSGVRDGVDRETLQPGLRD
ncbi:hypothetical protein L202_03032 [Cryptococcus amylolentus CBS 6039]|uniref:Uncharacterized protein n=2 Tax=Cryptococcus amylolentus TaxID=104669 RepID=A0A1E3HX72_9TREE|nr:hypothetical protein L202_03032 [Cryptococcus amylolentus CBS 6039]ODN80907.1 hypothetical protein L202_03032 [Cryptococcus amylolentus CBS 6039]ODO09406.1 hypothetical protein I350_03006 [Cryptococcus amylolentus CBS 6273]